MAIDAKINSEGEGGRETVDSVEVTTAVIRSLRRENLHPRSSLSLRPSRYATYFIEANGSNHLFTFSPGYCCCSWP